MKHKAGCFCFVLFSFSFFNSALKFEERKPVDPACRDPFLIVFNLEYKPCTTCSVSVIRYQERTRDHAHYAALKRDGGVRQDKSSHKIPKERSFSSSRTTTKWKSGSICTNCSSAL